jgi:hypothetical protein
VLGHVRVPASTKRGNRYSPPSGRFQVDGAAVLAVLLDKSKARSTGQGRVSYVRPFHKEVLDATELWAQVILRGKLRDYPAQQSGLFTMCSELLERDLDIVREKASQSGAHLRVQGGAQRQGYQSERWIIFGHQEPLGLSHALISTSEVRRPTARF